MSFVKLFSQFFIQIKLTFFYNFIILNLFYNYFTTNIIYDKNSLIKINIYHLKIEFYSLF